MALGGRTMGLCAEKCPFLRTGAFLDGFLDIRALIIGQTFNECTRGEVELT